MSITATVMMCNFLHTPVYDDTLRYGHEILHVPVLMLDLLFLKIFYYVNDYNM